MYYKCYAPLELYIAPRDCDYEGTLSFIATSKHYLAM